jgi:hypothetical protein
MNSPLQGNIATRRKILTLAHLALEFCNTKIRIKKTSLKKPRVSYTSNITVQLMNKNRKKGKWRTILMESIFQQDSYLGQLFSLF